MRQRTGGGISLEPWISQLRACIPAARAGDDPEKIHQLRTALARLEVGALLLGSTSVRQRLRRLRRRAAGVRDLDVVISLGPPARSARRLRKKRAHRLRRLQRVLDAARCAALIEALAALPPIDPASVRPVVARLAARARRDARRSRRSPRDLAALHAARRSLRRLRYALDWLGRPSDELAHAQALMGAVCDRVLAQGAFGRGGAWRARLARSRRRSERRVRRHWSALRPFLDSYL